MYEVYTNTFRTPRGYLVTLSLRKDTNDHNTLYSCLDGDEYRLKELHPEGTVLDVGAYIGGVTIALAVDNPDLKVIAIEAVPPNVELLRENVERNGLAERVTVVPLAATDKGKTATIRWAFAGNESADHHAFVGNSSILGPEVTHKASVIEAITLRQVIRRYGPISFAKVDCEGCEYPFLRGKALESVAHIRGEYHYAQEPLRAALEATHTVTFTEPAPGEFEAVRRG